MVDATERLKVLLTQENDFYMTSDYLPRMQNLAKRNERPFGTSEDDAIPPSPKKRKAEDCKEEEPTRSEMAVSNTINKHWREKICEWAYQGK